MGTVENIGRTAQPKSMVEQLCRSIVIDYLLSTSTHGLHGVGRAHSIYNRLFWIMSFVIAIGLMFYFVVSSVLQYYAYPTQTNTEITLDRSMSFPAVTICNANPFRLDKINASLVHFFYRLHPSNTTFDQNIANHLAYSLISDLGNRNQTEELWSIGFQLSDMLLACTYNGMDCSNAFISSFSSALGNCFTFNWKTSTPFFTIADFGTAFVLKEGLTMTFYVPRELNLPLPNYDVGLTVLLHDNVELPVPNENGLNLQPGLSHVITYHKSQTMLLPPPYTHCTSTVGVDLRALYETTFLDQTASSSVAYSESVCDELCEQAYIFSICSCIVPLPFFTRQVLTFDGKLIYANTCNPLVDSQLNCVFNAEKQFAASDRLQNRWCSHCASQCVHTSFANDLSAQYGPSDTEKAAWLSILLNGSSTTAIALPNDFAQHSDHYFDRNYLKVRVTCGSKYVTEYKQVAKLSFVDTFAAIGGQTSL